MNKEQRATRYPKGKKTVGNIINHIAESFSQEADFNGLFILEEALKKAKELKSFKQRMNEANAIFEEIGLGECCPRIASDAPNVPTIEANLDLCGCGQFGNCPH